EVAAMVSAAGALVVNIGTLNPFWVVAMKKAMRTAEERRIPIVLDPVGVGATPYRLETTGALLSAAAVSVIRGNASEIKALVSPGAGMKGVDSSLASDAAVAAAHSLSKTYGCVVSLSGATDYIVEADRLVCVRNGHPLMPRVTGMGCCATAFTAAFAAVNPDLFAAAAHAMVVMGIAGEIAARRAEGPGSFSAHFLDAVYGLSEKNIQELIRTGEGEK
ncbi:MAG: hydroxyethylthiazole kinase, partial [Spirochaetaceae bacterium]|nr:hydroxyethylthiazole kinase [Spirochaetaceae bacterium]